MQDPSAPDLVIEILSEATRRLDTVIKRQTYERFGVREYWLVDPHRQGIEVWTLTAEEYRRGAVLRAEAGDVLTPPLLLGLGISLAEIFKIEPS
jgi:Uma2 family endonuclease